MSDVAVALQQARTEDLTRQEINQYKCLHDSEIRILSLLEGPGCHLLEGSRGVGKSMLLRLAEFNLDETIKSNKVLGVYVNFKSSLVLEKDKFKDEKYSFKMWIMAKILQSFTEKLYSLGIIEGDSTLQPYYELFNIKGINNLGNALEKKITLLQRLALTKDSGERDEIENEIGISFANTFNDIEYVTKTIRDTSKKLNVDRVVFLFDEAAHTFVPEQQSIFFNMIKLLHGEEVSVKVAVYPGITNYGGNFEYGQDAIPIPLERNDLYSQSARKKNIQFYRELLQKRLQARSDLSKKFFQRGEVLDLIICLSNGNPRGFMHIVSKLVQDGEISTRNAILKSSEYIENELLKYHKDLKQRLPKITSVIDLGFDVVKNYILSELQMKNEGKAPGFKKQSVFFTIETTAPYKIQRAMDILCYSGLISKLGIVKIAQRKTAPRYSINLGLAVQNRIFAETFSRKPMEAIARLSKDDYREFSASDKQFEHLIDVHQDSMAPCSHCGRPRENIEFTGCPYCLTPYPTNDILPKLMEDPIQALSIPNFLFNYLSTNKKYKKVKDLYTASLEDLQEINRIGPNRARIIKNIAEEYLS